MLTQEEIEQLAAFDGQGAWVLSAYLNLDPASQVRRSHRIAFEDLVKEARERLEEPARGEFAGEIEEMESFKDFVFGKSDQGGVSQARYQQHHEAHVYWHSSGSLSAWPSSIAVAVSIA